MNESELKERIKKGEDFHTEFKETLPDRNKIIKEIVGFSNTDGGQLIFGVTDTGEVPGIENVDESMRVIDDLAYQQCEPPITVIQETINIQNKVILIVNIPKGAQRPYRTSGGQYYIRSSNRCQQASREELLRLFQSGESIYFDETTVHRANFKDITGRIPTILEDTEKFINLYLKEEHIINGLRRIITLVRAYSQKEVLLQETDSEFILTIPRP